MEIEPCTGLCRLVIHGASCLLRGYGLITGVPLRGERGAGQRIAGANRGHSRSPADNRYGGTDRGSRGAIRSPIWAGSDVYGGAVNTIEVEALTDQHDYAVIRLPTRKFPGVVVQGDSLSTLVADLRRALDCLRQGDLDVGIDEVAAVLESLDDVKRSYEGVLAAHSISLPY